MNRYINFDRLIFCLEDEWAWHSKKSERGLRTAMQIVKDQPIVDVVEVVRCKDCKHFVFSKNRAMCGRRATMDYGEWLGLTATDFDHYCSYGERRKE